MLQPQPQFSQPATQYVTTDGTTYYPVTVENGVEGAVVFDDINFEQQNNQIIHDVALMEANAHDPFFQEDSGQTKSRTGHKMTILSEKWEHFTQQLCLALD